MLWGGIMWFWDGLGGLGCFNGPMMSPPFFCVPKPEIIIKISYLQDNYKISF